MYIYIYIYIYVFINIQYIYIYIHTYTYTFHAFCDFAGVISSAYESRPSATRATGLWANKAVPTDLRKCLRFGFQSMVTMVTIKGYQGLVPKRDLHGMFMGFSWDVHGFFMGCSWVFHEMFMDFSSDVHGMFIGFAWDFHGILQNMWGCKTSVVPWGVINIQLGIPRRLDGVQGLRRSCAQAPWSLETELKGTWGIG